ncbi:MAG: GntR family transcriptional regulator [Candidatus Brocadiales bacterium]|nr:GntR family transcriptional regulator [Candidatus Brocadiales bacterium]MBL7006697.1 GntR family transcriptional regulator [Spirochaetia bacterium]
MDSNGNKKVKVYENLRRRIINIELTPGMPINEADFAEELGVSKTPIREALRQLEQDGFVENVPGRGSTISYITSHEIRDVFQIREIIETGAAKRIALTKGNEELKILRDEGRKLLNNEKANQELVSEWGSWENVHVAIVKSLENKALTTIYSGLVDRITRIRNNYGKKFTQRRFHDILTEHLEVLDAILDGDEKHAEAKMTKHLKNASNFIMGL